MCLLCVQRGLSCLYAVHRLYKLVDFGEKLIDCRGRHGVATVVVVAMVSCRGVVSLFSVCALVIGWTRVGFDERQLVAARTMSTVQYLLQDTKPPDSCSCFSGLSRQNILENGAECPYYHPVVLQCARHVISLL